MTVEVALVVLLVFLPVLASQSYSRSPRVVETKYGKLRGMLLSLPSRHLKPVEVFLGIPYATPPVGDLRFVPPVTPPPWDDVKMADTFGPVCPQNLPNIQNETEALERMPRGRLESLKQLLPFLTNQSEDCLYLNIYCSYQGREQAKKLMPVLVFIHGESFEWNSGNPYDGSVIASMGKIVVVTINYRLGKLGFLNTNPIPMVRHHLSNLGLMDQIAALHWVQENIQFFGGDPNNVTLMGHGPGAACITFLMLSPTVPAGHLFKKAILMSGSAYSQWALVKKPFAYATKLATAHNCSLPEDINKDHENIMHCLKKVKLEELMSTYIYMPKFTEAFGPSIDGVTITDSFLYNSDSVKQRLRPYTVMFGVASAEALFQLNDKEIEFGFEEAHRDKIFRTYVRNVYEYHPREIFAALVSEYTDWDKPLHHPVNIRDATVDALTDAQFVAPMMRFSQLLPLDDGRSYYYVFKYATKDSLYPQRQGCVHGEEMGYVFGAPVVGRINHFVHNYTKGELALSQNILMFFANFIHTGSPNDPSGWSPFTIIREKSRARNVIWSAFDMAVQKYLDIDIRPRPKTHYRSHKLALWLQLIPELVASGREDKRDDHHRFPDHDSPDIYIGAVRSDDSMDVIPINGAEVSATSTPPAVINTYHDNRTHLKVHEVEHYPPYHADSTKYPVQVNITNVDSSRKESHIDNGRYSLTMYVTIGIGCSLLLLNILILLIICHQKNTKRAEAQFYESSRSSSSGHIDALVGQRVMSAGYQSEHSRTPPGGGRDMRTMRPSSKGESQQQQQQTQLKTTEVPKQPNGSLGMILPVPDPPPPPTRLLAPIPESQPLLTERLRNQNAVILRGSGIGEMRV